MKKAISAILFAAAILPSWMQPFVIGVTEELPRLAIGKPDRLQCIGQLEALLERS